MTNSFFGLSLISG